MAAKIWLTPPTEIIQAYESRGKNRGPVGALIFWASLGVESLYYLADLEGQYQRNRQDNFPHRPEVKDISHIRWATSTAISSLDLCAAALGREYCSWNKQRELNLRDFDQENTSKKVSERRSKLPNLALDWVDGVLSDERYHDIHGARNPLTHSRLLRRFYLSSPTEFEISSTSKQLSSREIVFYAKELATDQVTAFLEVIASL